MTTQEGKRKTEVSKEKLASQLHDGKVSSLDRYKDKAYGTRSLLTVLAGDLKVFLFGDMAGGAGYLFRKMFYANMFRKAGRGTIFGRWMVLRHPGKISLGDRVSIDDNVMLDASGAGEQGITLGDDVIISRNCVIQGKTGPIRIGNRADIGVGCIFSSITGIDVGQAVLIAGQCYIGGGQYRSDRLDIPMMDQGNYSTGPVVIGDDVWLGSGVAVLDGVQVGKGAIIGSGAVVTRDIPEYSIAVGVPARVVSNRAERAGRGGEGTR